MKDFRWFVIWLRTLRLRAALPVCLCVPCVFRVCVCLPMRVLHLVLACFCV
jgi:hypothetical protein